MALRRQQLLHLADKQERDLGRLVIDRIEGDLVFGQFTPGPDCPQIERLFAEFVEAANQQLFSVVGELDAAISALGLHLCSPDGDGVPAVQDVQIGSGVINFRIRSQDTEAQQPGRPEATPLPTSALRSGIRTA